MRNPNMCIILGGDCAEVAELRERAEQAEAACAAYRKIIEEHADGWVPGHGVKPLRTPTHGNCCTCQECGHFHDDCVCIHNMIEAKMVAAEAMLAAAKEKS